MRARHHTRTERLINELDWIRATFPNGADAVYYNAEQQFDPVWAEHIGIDLDRLVIVESTTIEEIVELMQNYYPHVPLHVVDSTSNASTYLSQKHEVGKSLMGVDARQWKVCLRDSLPFFDPQRNIAILIHQLSTDIRSGAVKAQATRYMRFVSRLSVRFYHGKALYMKNGVLQLDPEKVGDEYDGREVFAKIEKSTVGRPFREASLQWDFNRGEFVAPHELASSALKFGLVMGGGPGGWYKTAEGERIGQGLKSVYAWLANDEEVRNQITCRLLDYTHER
jgi:recombination protein RecA